MGMIISTSKPYCHFSLSKQIFNMVSIYRENILGKQLSQAACSKYVSRLLHALKFQVFSTKLSIMVNCSQAFYEKAALMNLIRKHLWGSLFLNKVSCIQAKERLLHRCFPASSPKYIRMLFLQSISGWLLLLNTFSCLLRRPQPEKILSLNLGYFEYIRDKHYNLLANSPFRRVTRSRGGDLSSLFPKIRKKLP